MTFRFDASYKAGYAVIVGKPNVGKSTLMNRLVGEKLSITSAKPQTTRLAIKGIYNDAEKQIVFLDTPGFLKPRYEMQERMLRQMTEALNDADVVIFMSEVTGFPTDYDWQLLEVLKSVKRPTLALLNKTDLCPSLDEARIKALLPASYEEVLFISATSGRGVEQVIPRIAAYLPFSPPFYDPEQLSDLPMRFFAHETIREGIFHQYGEEIPYATAVLIDRYEELEDKVVIHATIWIERDSQKPILIGKKGEGLRRIREYAEKQFGVFLGMPVQFHLWVKLKKNWRKNPGALRQIGLRD